MANCGPKPRTNPFEKIWIFWFFEIFWFFFSQESRFFVLEYDKTHFAGLYWKKKKVWKNANFGPEP